MPLSRRDAIYSLTGALASPLLISRSSADVTPEALKFRPEIEPLVALIERTPREKCAEMAVEQLRRGVGCGTFLGALFLAGVRNVNPRPPGFALHCIFIIHSARLMSLEAPADARMLPLFFALDDFKSAQERDAKAPVGDYTMRPISGPLPSPERAAAELSAALDVWDAERAERAVAVLARNRTAGEVFALLWRYGARDYRNIGHKAIFVANAYRTLQAIGWQHAEPVLRSLVLGLADFGQDRELNGYKYENQCYLPNVARLKSGALRLDLGTADAGAARAILGSIRAGNPEEACTALAKGRLNVASLWDAVHLAAAELRMRAQGPNVIAGIHSVTSANALHYAYLSAPEARDRDLVLLQAVGWMAQFYHWANSRPEAMRTVRIDDFHAGDESASIEKIFAGIPSRVDASAAQVFSLAQDISARPAFLAAAMRLSLAKTNEVHYYKYLASLMEDIPLVSPAWQPHLHAAVVYYVKGPSDPEPEYMKRAREAMRSLA